MRHARFYQVVNGRLQQAICSDSCLIFDNAPGALTRLGMHNLAIKYAQQLEGVGRKYVGYAMFKGSSFTKCVPEDYKVFPTGVAYIPICAEAKPEHTYLWR